MKAETGESPSDGNDRPPLMMAGQIKRNEELKMVASKQQERDALKKIRAIVESLGEDSYIATAFDGCFEVAESNIENDFADSMKEKCEHAVARAEQVEFEADRLEEELEAAKATIERLEDEKRALQEKTLTDDDITDIRILLYERINEYEQMQTKTATEIVELAETPDSEMFKQFVRDNRTAKKQVEYYKAIVTRLDK